VLGTRRAGALALVLLGAALAGAPPAGALTRVGTAPAVREVHLAGPNVVFLDERSRGHLSAFRVRSATTHRAPRILARLEPLRTSEYGPLDLNAQIAASAGVNGPRVAIARDDSAQGDEPIDIHRLFTRRVLSGLLSSSEPLWTQSCSVQGEPEEHFEVALSGDAVVSAAPGCTHDGLVVRSHSGRGAVLRRLEDAEFQTAFDVAGPHVAYRLESRRLAVTNWESGERLFELDAGSAGAWPTSPLSVQDDGKVAWVVSSGNGCENRLAWASREEPVAHELALGVCGSDVRIAGDRIAFVRRRGGLNELVTTSLGGVDVVPVAAARSVDPGFQPGTFDFDGRRLAWSAPRCHDAAVYVDRARPARAAPPERARCPARVVRAPIRLDRGGRIRVPVRCPFGCTVDGQIETTRDSPTTAEGPISVPPGSRPGVLVFRVGSLEARRIRRRRPTRVQVQIESFHPDGNTSGDTARLLLSG
jgi:hypothetical protein